MGESSIQSRTFHPIGSIFELGYVWRELLYLYGFQRKAGIAESIEEIKVNDLGANELIERESRILKIRSIYMQALNRTLLLFPPATQEVQLDEKWSFVEKKEKNCDRTNPADNDKGDQWDHTAIDAETRLIISAVPGRRTLDSCVTLVQAVKDKTGDRTD
ncbi:hypothetical protein MNBD_GAMMA16-934, partial [hydrothermal vent metagenome]